MDPGTPPTLADSIAAAQAWWREAGVDLAYADTPRAWLAPETPDPATATPAVPAPTIAPPSSLPQARLGGEAATWPSDLASFQQWWLEDPTLDGGGLNPRVPPRGTTGARLLVLVPMPEMEDVATLLSGPHGRLIANMLRAMGIPTDQAYLAAALPRHTAAPDWTGLANAGLGDVLRHHLSLADPARILVLGRDVLPLLGHDPAQAAPALRELSTLAGTVPLLASYAPGRLLEHPRLRAELWRRWLDWTDGDTS